MTEQITSPIRFGRKMVPHVAPRNLAEFTDEIKEKFIASVNRVGGYYRKIARDMGIDRRTARTYKSFFK